ncbi:MAG: glycosyltransferase family 8 protein [Hungatella sp.]
MKAVYASNDHYARHLGTSLYSLLDCNQAMEEITVYLLSVNLSQKNLSCLHAIAKRFGRTLEVIELGEVKNKFDYSIDTGGFDISTMSRLFIGDVLPMETERVLYLDCDVVVTQSLQKLWNTDLGHDIIGAVMEPTIYQSVKEAIDLKASDPYYNAGVLLVNLRRWREEGVQKQLLDFYQSKGGRLFACDQDAINGALKGRIKPLSPRYNFFTNYRYFAYEELVSLSLTYRVVPKALFMQAKRHPAIIHYMGDERPWIAGNLNHYRKAYEHYLAETPWCGTPKEPGHRIYMLAYHLLDYVTVISPDLRRIISRHFGMKAVNARKKNS